MKTLIEVGDVFILHNSGFNAKKKTLATVKRVTKTRAYLDDPDETVLYREIPINSFTKKRQMVADTYPKVSRVFAHFPTEEKIKECKEYEYRYDIEKFWSDLSKNITFEQKEELFKYFKTK